jgi:hypothetical protein
VDSETVNKDVERRLEQVIERRRAELSETAAERDDGSRARRLAHAKLVLELPRVSARISGAVALLNDRLFDSELALEIERANHTPIAEAIYTVGVIGARREDPSLMITIDHTGAIRCILKDDGHRTVLGSYTVQSLDSAHLMDMLVTLLETHYR